MRIIAHLFCGILWAIVCAWAQPQANQWIGLDSLLARMQRHVDSVFPGGRLGISVRGGQGDLLASIRGQEWFVPASTLKVLITASSLDTFPVDFYPETRLSLEGRKIGQTFFGVIRVIGGGDPNISGRYLPDAMFIPLAMADSLRALGIDSIRGKIVADTSFYQGARRPGGWIPRFFNTWYGAEISALSFNDNCYRLTVRPAAKAGSDAVIQVEPEVGYVSWEGRVATVEGKKRQVQYVLRDKENHVVLNGRIGLNAEPFSVVLPVRNPARYFLAALRSALRQRGISVVDAEVETGRPVWEIPYRTAPLLSIIDEINQRSQNLHAEMLLRNLAAWRFGEGTAEAGLMAERLFLKKLGVQEQDFFLVDACGLSPQNRVKPDAMTLLLAQMLRHPRAELFYQSLAVPGISGSGKRLADIAEPHRARYKSGFINQVQGLVGYIATTRGDTLSVAFYLNGYRGVDQTARDLLDTLWSWMMVHQNAERQSVIRMRELYARADTIRNYRDRLAWFSKALEGSPYLLGPTGEGMGSRLESKPLMNFEAFDCVTFIEHVMALAAAPRADSVWPILQNIRYENGEIAFVKRKHYFVEDWIKKNPRWVTIRRLDGDTVIWREMNKKKFFSERTVSWPDSNPRTEIPYLPFDRALKLADKIWTDSASVAGIGFISGAESICVSHTGFLVLVPGERPWLRHASQLRQQVITQPLKEYLESRKGKTPGILLFDFLPP